MRMLRCDLECEVAANMRGKRCSDDLFTVICKTFDRTGGVRATARTLGLNEGSVSRMLKRRLGMSHTQRKVKLGRKLFRLPRNFFAYVKRHRHETFRQLAHQLQMSRMCIKRACQRLGLRSRPAVIDKLTKEQKQRRLQWVRDHANADFSGWIFSDESFFELADCSAPRRPRVLRTAAEKYCSACVLKDVSKDRHGVMVWGAITRNGLSAFCLLDGGVTATVYTSVLEEHLLGLLDELPLAESDSYTFQQDNARVHTGLEAQAFFVLSGVEPTDWPPYSPDLSPIENIWRLLKREVRKRRPRNMQELREAIRSCWQEVVTPERCRALFETMPRKMNEVRRKRGML